MEKETILVTGSNGLLGQKLTDLYLQNNTINLVATGKGLNRYPSKEGYVYQEMDIANSHNVKEVLEMYQPSVVIHTAAMTQVDDCEFKKEECVSLNIDSVKNLSELSAEMGFHLVHLSTDFIFDGTKSMYTETDEPNPLSYYGWSKLEAEKMVIKNAKSWSILRTILVYGQVADMSRSNIILWTYNTLKEQKSAKVVYDQFRTPTLAEDLAMGCFLAAEKKAQGIFNIAGKDYVSIIELVEKVANMYHFSTENIETVSSDTLNQPAKRPPITGLNIQKAQEELGYEPHSLEEGIKICLGKLD
jgi:dTDP-4-dehydrorhamnose reductase